MGNTADFGATLSSPVGLFESYPALDSLTFSG
jgi:hypothetical protein